MDVFAIGVLGCALITLLATIGSLVNVARVRRLWRDYERDLQPRR